MTNFRLSARRGGLWTVLAGLCVACLLGHALTAQEKQDHALWKAHVFIHPDKLTDKDTLTDGKGGKPIEIKSETTFLWVDLSPGARFGHPTEYILISAEGTRVVKGSWWPILNGKALFTDGEYKADFPIKLSWK